MYAEANFHDKTVPVNQEHSNKHDKVVEAIKNKELKESRQSSG